MSDVTEVLSFQTWLNKAAEIVLPSWCPYNTCLKSNTIECYRCYEKQYLKQRLPIGLRGYLKE